MNKSRGQSYTPTGITPWVKSGAGRALQLEIKIICIVQVSLTKRSKQAAQQNRSPPLNAAVYWSEFTAGTHLRQRCVKKRAY
jgi:hypothetical protein